MLLVWSISRNALSLRGCRGCGNRLSTHDLRSWPFKNNIVSHHGNTKWPNLLPMLLPLWSFYFFYRTTPNAGPFSAIFQSLHEA